MNSKKLVGLVPALMLVFALIPMGYAQDPAPAQLTVSKAITQIYADGELVADGEAEITAFLANVPNYTPIVFVAALTVQNTGGVEIYDVVVTDHFGAELDVTCISETDPTCVIDPKGKAADRLIWEVGYLGLGGSAQLIVEAATNLNPADHQRYTSCGLHYFNSGPTAKGQVEFAKPNGSVKMRQISDYGDPIALTVSGLEAVALPQCSNCTDDDLDGNIDLDDPECVDSLDDNEFE